MGAGFQTMPGTDEYADPCCFGTCTQSNCCRDFETVHLTDLKTHSRAGDVLLFDSKCSLGTCCTFCFTRSDFDHVAVIYHGASLTEAKKANGEHEKIKFEGPHLCEALSPECIIGPMENVVQPVVQGGGRIFWRKLIRPLMEGESEGPIPRHMKRISDPFPESMPGGFAWGSTKVGDSKSNGKTTDVAVMAPDSDEAASLAAAIVDYHKVPNNNTQDNKEDFYRQLKKPLNYRQWNQACYDTAGMHYEESAMSIVNASFVADDGFWSEHCCECCCARGQEHDTRTMEEKLEAHNSLFCSELAALMMLRGGWRKGADMSDMYLPKDFTNDNHQLLSPDLADGVCLGPMVEVLVDTYVLEQGDKVVAKHPELGDCWVAATVESFSAPANCGPKHRCQANLKYHTNRRVTAGAINGVMAADIMYAADRPDTWDDATAGHPVIAEIYGNVPMGARTIVLPLREDLSDSDVIAANVNGPAQAQTAPAQADSAHDAL